MAGRIPLTGFAYSWNTRLANPFIGWLTGWTAIINYAVGVAAVTTTMLPVIGIVLGHELTGTESLAASVFIILAVTLINVYGVKLASQVNTAAVCAEIIAMLGLAAVVFIAAVIKGHPNYSLLTTIPETPRPYWPGFMMSCLLGAWTFIGFEGGADMSEETISVKQVAPKGIISSMVVSSIVGFIFIVAMAVTIPDLATTSAAPYPITAIASAYLGDGLVKVFLVFVLIAMFACILINMAGGARLLFAMARDARFPASTFFQKISAHQVPLNAIWFIAIVGVFFTVIADSATSLYGAITVLAALIYLVTVVSYAFKVQTLPPTNSFTLGKWQKPVVFLSVLWLVVEICILTIPEEFHLVALTSVSVLAVGLLVYCVSVRKLKAR